MARRALSLAACAGALALLAVAAAPADAKVKWKIKGAGFGHGVGMSQYGAYGYAQHGAGYQAILTHYYTGTSIGSAGAKTVRVLLRPNLSSVVFSSASSACGVALTESKSYSATRFGSQVVLHNGGQDVELRRRDERDQRRRHRHPQGQGLLSRRDRRPRGERLRAQRDQRGSRSTTTCAASSPASRPLPGRSRRSRPRPWRRGPSRSRPRSTATASTSTTTPAARSTAGSRAETSRTNAAVAQTANQAVLYAGKPIAAYFFSTSGGYDRERRELVRRLEAGSLPQGCRRSL